MLQGTDKIWVENRSDAIVCYRIPETNYIRRFVAKEKKEIPMSELRAAVQIPGTRTLIKDDLIIHSAEAVKELLPEVEPEYFYTEKDVLFLLENGSLDQLRDALDFAPEGVILMIKDLAVKTKLNDMSKREVILQHTGFNVSKAIEINQLSEKPEAETKTRRTAALGQSVDEGPTRRAAAPVSKYKLVDENK